MTAAAPAHARPTARLVERVRRPDRMVLSVLGLWTLTRLATHLVTTSGSWLLSGRPARSVMGFQERWTRWDVSLYRKVAEFGYEGYPRHYPDKGIEGFFPGYPLLLRGVHALVPSWTVAGMLISGTAGAVAVVGLARLAELEGGPGTRTVLYLLVSPYAVFLAAAYSESLFLAPALWGWYAARRGHWATAGLLVALACTVRINGLFLALALVVELVQQRRSSPRPPRLREAGWLVLPAFSLVGYSAYLWSLTGDPLRWLHAQQEGWGRRVTLPWDALEATLRYTTSPRVRSDFSWTFAAEIVSVAVGLLATGLLLRGRRWSEAAYVGLSVSALATSSYYLSVDRATLLWFPLWLLLARAGHRWPALHTTYLVLAAPLSALVAVAFTNGRWLG